MEQPQVIFFDVDDVVLNTNENMVRYLNKHYREPNHLTPRTQADCRDWGYKSIWRILTKKEMESIFDREEFWETMELKPGFIKLLKSGLLRKFPVTFVTKGSEQNLKLKYNYILNSGIVPKYLQSYHWIGLPLHEPKSSIDMTNGIMVDDNYYNFDGVNSRLNILVKNNIETEYNNSFRPDGIMDNLYTINDVSELIDLLEFCYNKKIML